MHSKGTMLYFLKGLPSTQAETLRYSYNTRDVTEKKVNSLSYKKIKISACHISVFWVLLGSRFSGTELKMIKKYCEVYFYKQPM